MTKAISCLNAGLLVGLAGVRVGIEVIIQLPAHAPEASMFTHHTRGLRVPACWKALLASVCVRSSCH